MKNLAYNLIPKELEIPGLYSQEKLPLEDHVLHVKLFDPYSQWTWYVCEYDPKEEIAFCYTIGLENEWGEVYIPELKELTKYGMQRIERDLHFQPTKFSELKKENQMEL